MSWRTTALCAVLGAWVWVWSWSPLAFELRFRHRVHGGMTLGEAEAVLGKGEFRKRGITEFRGNPQGDWRVIVVREDTEFYLWRRGGMEIWLGFLDGRLVHKFFYANLRLFIAPPRAGNSCSSPAPRRVTMTETSRVKPCRVHCIAPRADPTDRVSLST